MDLDYSPVLIVGVGGTGASVLRCLKRRLGVYAGRDPGPVRMLLIDGLPTEQHRDGVRFSEEEFYDTAYDPPGVQREVDAKNPAWAHIDWLPAAETYRLPAQGHGNQQTRCVGRLGFYQHFGAIEDRLEATLRKLSPYAEPKLGQPARAIQAYLVCSVCGGTGAGIFLDLAYLIQKHLADRAGATLTGCLVLPGGFGGRDVDRRMIQANAYAALKELDHFMAARAFDCTYGAAGSGRRVTVNKRPFDLCFLVEGENEQGHELAYGYEDVAHLLAEAIFLRFGSGPSGVGDALLEDYNNFAYRLDLTFRGKPKGYSAMGLRGLVMPVEQAAVRSAPHAAATRVADLLNAPRPAEADVETQLDRFMRAHDLAATDTDHQLISALKAIGPGGSTVRFASGADQVDLAEMRTVATQLENLEARLREGELAKAQARIGQRAAELSGQLAAVIREQVAAIVDDPEGGLAAAEVFLSCLQARLSTDRRRIESQRAERELKQAAGLQQLVSSRGEIDRLARAWLQKPKVRLTELGQRVPQYLTLMDKTLGRELAGQARAAAAELLLRLSDLTADLLERVAELHKTLQRLHPTIKATSGDPTGPDYSGRFSLLEAICDDDFLLQNVKAAADGAGAPSTWLNLAGERSLDAAALQQALASQEEGTAGLVFPPITARLDEYMAAHNVRESGVLAYLTAGAAVCLKVNRNMLGSSDAPVESRVLAGPGTADPLTARGQIRTSPAGDLYRLVLLNEVHCLPLLALPNVAACREAYEAVQDAPRMVRPLHLFRGAETWPDPTTPEDE